MGFKERVKNIYDFIRRPNIRLLFSVVINLSFIIYNSFLGIFYRDAFAIGISIYYVVLFWIMLASLIIEKAISKKEENVKFKTRARNYFISSIFVFILDFCLIAPIILMVTQPKPVKFGLIPAIAMATYCVYKIVVAIVNYTRSKKSKNPTTILLKEINIIGAIVSVLTLQHTLIMVNGGMTHSMKILSLWTSIGFIILIVIFSVFSFYKNKRDFKNIK